MGTVFIRSHTLICFALISKLIETTQNSWQMWKTFFMFFYENKICLISQHSYINVSRNDWKPSKADFFTKVQRTPKHVLTALSRNFSELISHYSQHCSINVLRNAGKTFQSGLFHEGTAHPKTRFGWFKQHFSKSISKLSSLIQRLIAPKRPQMLKTTLFLKSAEHEKTPSELTSATLQTYVWE